MGLQLPNLNEGFSIEKINRRIRSFAVVFFKNFELGDFFLTKKTFYFRRNRYILRVLRSLDVCNGLSLLGSHLKDCPVRF
jgi:hypothetical protein